MHPLIAIGIVDAVASIGGALAIHNANRNAAKDLAEGCILFYKI